MAKVEISGFQGWLPMAVMYLGGVGLVGSIGLGAYQARAEAARIYKADMTDYLAGQLKGKSILSSAEKYYPKVEVTPAGNSLAEAIAMKSSGQMVNVRDYPGSYLPNGVETKVLGKIALGEVIFNVILTPGYMPNSPVKGMWGVFDCSRGTANSDKVAWNNSDTKVEASGQTAICAIYSDYLSTVK